MGLGSLTAITACGLPWILASHLTDRQTSVPSSTRLPMEEDQKRPPDPQNQLTHLEDPPTLAESHSLESQQLQIISQRPTKK